MDEFRIETKNAVVVKKEKVLATFQYYLNLENRKKTDVNDLLKIINELTIENKQLKLKSECIEKPPSKHKTLSRFFSSNEANSNQDDKVNFSQYLRN